MTCLLLLTLLVTSLAPSTRAYAESGSCYAAERLDDGFLRTMLLQLGNEGKAFRLANGDYYAVHENLPNATICNLKDIDLTDVDLSDMDLSDAEIDATLLDKAALCNTILPGGVISRRDCE